MIETLVVPQDEAAALFAFLNRAGQALELEQVAGGYLLPVATLRRLIKHHRGALIDLLDLPSG